MTPTRTLWMSSPTWSIPTPPCAKWWSSAWAPATAWPSWASTREMPPPVRLPSVPTS